jgi:hypothetical protein
VLQNPPRLRYSVNDHSRNLASNPAAEAISNVSPA